MFFKYNQSMDIHHPFIALLISSLLFLPLSGCAGETVSQPTSPTAAPPQASIPPAEPVTVTREAAFLPPSPSQTPSPLPLPVETILPTQTPDCENNLTFVEDLTVPDGSVILPGEPVDKRWKVANSGECNWDGRYTLRLIAGPEMGAETEQSLFPGRSGTEVTIQIHFIAPAEPGTYRSSWQAFDPDVQPFGDPITIDILVSP